MKRKQKYIKWLSILVVLLLCLGCGKQTVQKDNAEEITTEEKNETLLENSGGSVNQKEESDSEQAVEEIPEAKGLEFPVLIDSSRLELISVFEYTGINSDDEDIFAEEGGFDRGKLAKVIFSDPQKRQKLNGIVHPAVKEYVLEQVAIEKNNHLSILVLEAALLIEEHYDTICDELWYIYTTRDNRRIRLKESRGYSDEKIDGIFASQLSEEEYRRACHVVIDNNSSLEKSYEQIEQALQIGKELKHE